MAEKIGLTFLGLCGCGVLAIGTIAFCWATVLSLGWAT